MFVYLHIIVCVGRVARRLPSPSPFLSSPFLSLPLPFYSLLLLPPSPLSPLLPFSVTVIIFPFSFLPSVPASPVRLSSAASPLAVSCLLHFYSHKWSDKSGCNESTNSRDRGPRVQARLSKAYFIYIHATQAASVYTWVTTIF